MPVRTDSTNGVVHSSIAGVSAGPEVEPDSVDAVEPPPRPVGRWTRLALEWQVVLLVSLSFALVLLVGAALAVHNARRAVDEEIESSAHLALQLLEVAVAAPGQGDSEAALSRLREALRPLRATRHLNLEVLDERGRSLLVDVVPAALEPRLAPGWFVALLDTAPLEFRRPVALPGVDGAEVIVRADPADEIDEAWVDVRGLLLVLLGWVVLANLLVALTVRRALRPVAVIRRALDGIEQGDFRVRLPPLPLPELDGIARQFNHMAEVLERSRSENRRLARRNIAIQEEERRHLARELHDEMGQSLSAIRAVAVAIESRAAQGDPEVVASARDIARISSRVYDVAREMMHRLRPAVLDELGLVAALSAMVDDWNAHHGDTFCRFNCDTAVPPLDEATEIGVYRIVQECLTNVARHARAAEVVVDLSSGPGAALRLSVQDDGIGFDPERTPRGLGLQGIGERVEALGGRSAVVAQPGRGVRIWVELAPRRAA